MKPRDLLISLLTSFGATAIALPAFLCVAQASTELPVVEVRQTDDAQLDAATAQSKQSLSAQTLTQQQPTSLEEVAVYLPNVQASRVSAGGSDDFIIRGFSLGGRLMLDGVLGNQSVFERDLATIESVEFIKGHASVLYGAGAPGGTVNFISKVPLAKPQTELSLGVGSDNYRRLVIDSTGPMDQQAKLTYRTILALNHTDTWKENVSDRQFTLMNRLDWHYDSSGSLAATYELSRQTYPWDFDNVYANGAPVYDVSYVHPATYAKRLYHRLSFDWQQALDSQTWLEAKTHFYWGKRDERKVGFYYLWADDQPLVGFYQEVDDDYQQASAQLSLHRNYQLAAWQGTWQFGVARNRIKDVFDSDRAVGTFGLDIYEPDFDITLPSEDQLSPRDIYTTWHETSVFAFNEMQLTPQLAVSFGVRRSHYDLLSTRNGYPIQDNQESDRSYSAGVRWKLSAQQQLYSSYSQSFLPNVASDSEGNSFAPKEGEQYELGWLSRPNPNLQLQVSLFDITQSNLLTRDAEDPANYILAGTYKAKGLEVASQWQMTQAFKATLNVGLIDAHVADNNDGYEGNEFFSTPKKNGSLWLSYQATPQWLWQAGAVYQGKRAGDLANSFYVDAYTRYDAAVQYQADKQNRFNFSVQNLTDINYVSYSAAQDFVRFGDPITFRVSYYHQF